MRISAVVFTLFVIAGCREVVMPNDPMPAIVDQPRKVSTAGKSAKTQAAVETSRHPRLLVTAAEFERAKSLNDVMVRRWSEEVIADARKVLSEPPPKYEAAKGIEVARKLQLRVTHLAVAYRITGDGQFADRARQDLLEAANFANWDQPSFLATAETTATVAIGYDWLFDVLSEGDRATLRRAIIDKGLRPGLAAFKSRAFWVEAKHNWNLVANGGMILGALAVVDDEPGVAKSVIAQARASLQNGLSAFAPDGGWEEGPTYWNYATRFLGYAVASLRSATGSMQGLEDFAGLDRTGDFRMHGIGPTGKNFNFADSTEKPGDSPQMFALAWAFKRPQYAAFERGRSAEDPGVFDLIWYQPNDVVTRLTNPTGAYFRGRCGVAALRSSWDDHDATYIAFKGGTNTAHHGHLDLGTFVLDALGERWAVDLGSDRYDLPGYSSRTRFTFYRYSTPGQNTLSINGGNQDVEAEAPLVAFMNTPSRSHAAVDLTEAYANKRARRVMRGIALLNGGRDALVQDELWFDKKAKDVNVTWTIHTRAKVELQGRTAVLRQDGKALTATLLYPPGAAFSASPATAPAPQDPNEGVTRLQVKFEVTAPTHIAVLFTPGKSEPNVPRLTPVSRWEDAAKVRLRR
jgi:hypothetical protein